MSFPYGPGTWTPRSAAEHASDILGNINAILQVQNVLDSDGNLIQLAASLGNVVWLLCLAVGQSQADDDEALLAASQEFSLAQESDAQLLETLPMTGTSLIPGAYSLVTLTVTVDSTGATIPAGTKAALGTICNFLTLATTAIAGSGSAQILCESDTLGPIAVAPGQLTSFTTTIPHVLTVTNAAAAVLGRNVETTQQLRQRLLAGNVVNTNLDGTIRAILGIQGITSAVVYLNVSPTTSLALVGVSVPALSAYIVVAGSDITNVGIADAYAERMLAQTYSVGPGTPTAYSSAAIAFSSADNSINKSGGSSFAALGWGSGMWLQVGGSSVLNLRLIGKIQTVAANKLTMSQCSVVTEGSGSAIVLTVKDVQEYTTASGQKIPIQFDYATDQTVYVKVYYDATTVMATGFDTVIQNLVAAIPWAIGQPVTSTLVLAALGSYTYARITGAQVSLDNSNWHNEVLPNANCLPTIAAGSVTVVAG